MPPMSNSLFNASLRSLSGSEIYDSVLNFTRVGEPLGDRHQENFTLEFKKVWNDPALKDVAAFANTFGGMIFVGVSEIDGRPEGLVGVPSRAELKTRIASSIATSLYPSPDFEIGECSLPGDESRRLAVVRINPSNDMCLITKKGLGSNPIYVRNEDESVPADASQVRALLARKIQLAGESPRRGFTGGFLATDFVYGGASHGFSKVEPYFRVTAEPTSSAVQRLDLGHESTFGKAVRTCFRGLERSGVVTTFDRNIEWFEIRGDTASKDQAMRWRLTSGGDVAFVIRLSAPGESNPLWSLYDVIAYCTYGLQAASAFWRSVNYFGEASWSVTLVLPGAELREFETGGFTPAYLEPEDTGVPYQLSSRLIIPAADPRDQASTGLLMDFNGITEGLATTVGELMNQLLRGLGHGVRLEMLEEAAGLFAAGPSQGQRS